DVKPGPDAGAAGAAIRSALAALSGIGGQGYVAQCGRAASHVHSAAQPGAALEAAVVREKPSVAAIAPEGLVIFDRGAALQRQCAIGIDAPAFALPAPSGARTITLGDVVLHGD